MTGRSVRIAARAGLLAGGLGWLLLVFGFWGDSAVDAASRPLGVIAAFYALTLMTFSALPASRRNDLSIALVAAAVLLALARQAVDGHRHLYEAAWAAIGVAAVHMPSHLEALRKLMRENPGAQAFAGPAKNRRADAPTLLGPTLLGMPLPLLVAWGLGFAIVIFTLGPQAWRPHLAGAATERFGAYFLAGLAFAVAYPKRRGMIALAAVTAAILLELAQFAAPGRDPGVPDAIAKAIGGLAGVCVAAALPLIWKRAKPSRLTAAQRAA